MSFDQSTTRFIRKFRETKRKKGRVSKGKAECTKKHQKNKAVSLPKIMATELKAMFSTSMQAFAVLRTK